MQNIYFDDSAVMSAVLAINDRNIPYLELLLGSETYVTGN